MGKSVVVVGAGITGVSSAEWLRRDGWVVTLVDRVEPGSAEQTSFGNAGLLARSAIIPVSVPGLWSEAPAMLLDPNSPLFLRWSYLPKLLPWLVPFLRNGTVKKVTEITAALAALTNDSVDQHSTLAKDTPAEEFIRTGEYVYLYKDKAEYDSDPLSAALRKKHGFVPDKLDRAKIVERDPNLGPRYTFATVFKDYGWLSSPSKYMEALFNHYLSQGGEFKHGTVVDIAAGDTPTVTLQGGEKMVADKVVLSAGAWSGPIAKKLGLNVKLEAERGYHVSMYNPNFTAPNPYMITDSKFVMTPMEGFLRAAGIVEFGGLDAPASDAPINLLRKQMKSVYPKLDFEYDEIWMGRRPTTPDSLPIVGEEKNSPNIIHAYGGQHVGLTIGPRLGRMVADVASDRQVNMDMNPYRPNRF